MKADGHLRHRARQLQKSMTRHEATLWIQLKAFNKEYGFISSGRRSRQTTSWISLISADASSLKSIAGSIEKRAEPGTIQTAILVSRGRVFELFVSGTTKSIGALRMFAMRS